MKTFAITKPVITEKSYKLASTLNVYTFEVAIHTTKNQVREAIQEIFPVTVTAVRTVTQQPRAHRVGRKRLLSHKAKRKRALVTLKTGDSIDLFNIGSEEKVVK
ncbi:MAG: 50S ribosomal protein L23 [Candidatus Pacebacteria bacterium]|nr:50S ribosomal protein L23 [Candidatus Paceibacterota bacterium]PIR60530.1 MAG: 50S ribosomal protein L23 [Candidatus Pacebacteria bacterium CG10_big_fil_rev_8_21_14_0_10_44_54]